MSLPALLSFSLTMRSPGGVARAPRNNDGPVTLAPDTYKQIIQYNHDITSALLSAF